MVVIVCCMYLYCTLYLVYSGMEEWIYWIPEFKQTIKSLSAASVFCIIWTVCSSHDKYSSGCIINSWHMFTYLIYPCVSLATLSIFDSEHLSNTYLNVVLSTHITLQLVTKVTLYNFHATDDQRAVIQCKTLAHAFCDTDNPTTIYGHWGKLWHMLSMILMIQWPYSYCRLWRTFVLHKNFIFCHFTNTMTIQWNSC